ncbi:MAG: Two component transcriptional regulator, LuxR family [candidate division NC10 bacterium]|nr:Two component transcriptional regulator, LuxR family [candidate division NC10 bacterium]
MRPSEVLIDNIAVRMRVLLADDQPPMLAQIARVLGNRYEIVGMVGDGLSLLGSAARLDPDVIVSDVTMPGIDGFGAARSLKRAGCRSRLVFLTVHEDPDFAREAMSLGADAYVVKSRLASDLLTAILEAVAGRKFVSPTVNR